MKARVAIVVQRWAPGIAGGSEALAWQYAGLLADEFDVDLLTSTALDYVTWNSELPAGATRIDGVCVHRFAPAFQRGDYFFALDRRERADREAQDARRLAAVWTTALQEELIKFQGPWCPGLMQHLEAHADSYHAVLLCTYLYPTSYFATARIPPHKLLMAPTLHDEPMAYLPVYRRYRERIARFLWLTEAERDVARRLWDVEGGAVIGMAIDAVAAHPEAAETPYLLYCGRIDVHKNCHELLEWFALYRAGNPDTPLKLVLTGKDALGLRTMPDVEFLGFVSEERKLALMAGAQALVQPSRYESFSIVVLEAMSQGAPILVNGACEVLAEHVEKSGSGYAYRSREEFDGALRTLAALGPREREEQAKRARDYAVKRYGRAQVRERLVAEVRAVVDPSERDGIVP